MNKSPTMRSLSTLVSQRMTALNISRRELGHRIGYKNEAKAYRQLDALVQRGILGCEHFMNRLITVLNIPATEYFQAIESDRKNENEHRQIDNEIQHIEKMANWNPYLWRIGEHDEHPQHPLFVIAFMGINTFKLINLPHAITERNLEEQQEMVRRIITDDVKRDGSPFGRTVGYEYHYASVGDYWKCDRDGKFLELCHCERTEPEASLSFGNKTVIAGDDGILSGDLTIAPQ